MDIHDWIHQYAAKAIEARDREHYQLVALTGQALPLVSKDPDQALALLEEGKAEAERLEEPWFVRFYEHWMIQALLFHKRDPSAALPMAEAAVQETSGPDYADFPQRICLREDLIFSYLSRDPQGYSQQIEKSIDYMREQIPNDSPCLNCFQEIQTAYCLARGRLDEAEQAALDAVKLAWPVSDYHHVLSAFTSLCQVAFQRQDWQKLAHWSGMGQTFEGREVGVASVHELLLWQAVAIRRRGDAHGDASKLYRKVRRLTRSMGSTPAAGFFDALFAYHEADANPRLALAACNLELGKLSGQGEVVRECQVRLRRRRLLFRLGRPADEEEAAVRALAATLADPEAILLQLAGA